MAVMSFAIKYPRRVVVRSLFRFVVRGLFPILSKTVITGLENFPKGGPLIVVGNHTGAMEVVLMGTYSPRILEFMGAVEIPWHGWMGKVVDLYSLIPVYRGYTSVETMKLGIDVLKQGGMLGLFPEGGFWEPGQQKAQTGAAWLSYMTNSPLLPIGFGDTRGKMAELFQLKRPFFEMHVGELLPPVQLDRSIGKKISLQQEADRIMEAVWNLVPEIERQKKTSRPVDEIFSLEIKILDQAGKVVNQPPELTIRDGSWISRFAHRPNLIDTIRDYVFIPVQVLKELDRRPSAEEIYQAAHTMIEYVENENPQYFNFRYGYQDGQAFLESFIQLRGLMRWVMENQYQVEAEVRYEYRDPNTGTQRILRVPEEINQW